MKKGKSKQNLSDKEQELEDGEEILKFPSQNWAILLQSQSPIMEKKSLEMGIIMLKGISRFSDFQ